MSRLGNLNLVGPRSGVGPYLMQLAGQETAGRQRALGAASDRIGDTMNAITNRRVDTARAIAQLQQAAREERARRVNQTALATMRTVADMLEGRAERKSRETIEAGRTQAYRDVHGGESNLLTAGEKSQLNAAARAQVEEYQTEFPDSTWKDARNAYIRLGRLRTAGERESDPTSADVDAGAAIKRYRGQLEMGEPETPERLNQLEAEIEALAPGMTPDEARFAREFIAGRRKVIQALEQLGAEPEQPGTKGSLLKTLEGLRDQAMQSRGGVIEDFPDLGVAVSDMVRNAIAGLFRGGVMPKPPPTPASNQSPYSLNLDAVRRGDLGLPQIPRYSITQPPASQPALDDDEVLRQAIIRSLGLP